MIPWQRRWRTGWRVKESWHDHALRGQARESAVRTASPLRSSRLLIVLMLGLGAMLLQSCATQPPPTEAGLPGFIHGLIHGFLIVFGFVASIFTDYRIYAYPNAGGWYDFGYLLGAMAFLGGSGAGTCRGSR